MAYQRFLVVGGAAANTRLWISDRHADVWRESVELPHGAGKTVYGASLVERDNRVYMTGGFEDPDAVATVSNAGKVYALVPNSFFQVMS